VAARARVLRAGEAHDGWEEHKGWYGIAVRFTSHRFL
jgi:hypothetical protein